MLRNRNSRGIDIVVKRCNPSNRTIPWRQSFRNLSQHIGACIKILGRIIHIGFGEKLGSIFDIDIHWPDGFVLSNPFQRLVIPSMSGFHHSNRKNQRLGNREAGSTLNDQWRPADKVIRQRGKKS